ncbi:hypothetical protein ACQ10A_15590, partial [Enterococcus faecalis]
MQQAGLSVMLSKEQTKDLQNYVVEITKEGIDLARIESGLERPFLKGKQMAEYMGVSYGTFLKFKKLGLPTILIDTLELY